MFNDVTSAVLQVALSGLAARQRSIANNIANIQTPGYRAETVQFEGALRRAITDDTPPDQVTATTSLSTEPTLLNGNNVNLDTETLANVSTGLQYQMMLRGLDARFTDLHTAIKG